MLGGGDKQISIYNVTPGDGWITIQFTINGFAAPLAGLSFTERASEMILKILIYFNIFPSTTFYPRTTKNTSKGQYCNKIIKLNQQ